MIDDESKKLAKILAKTLYDFGRAFQSVECVLQGRCTVCGEKRIDQDKDPRCPKCRIINCNHTS